MPSQKEITPQTILQEVFGYDSFRPGQEKVINAVLAGHDCIGLMPTGAGKSLTYQIPARLLQGTVLVLSPLISLMKDQVDALVQNGFRATVINSTLSHQEKQQGLADFQAGRYELVYMAPEALDGSAREFLQKCPIAMVVVDEAHCISQWGHDFRPAYRRLQGLKNELGDVPILALTATATRRVVADILRQLGMVKPEGFKGSFFRPNLKITCQKKGKPRNLRRDILGVIQQRPGESGIVYCLSRKTVEGTAEYLRAQGLRARPYHAGLSDQERARHQEAFARDELDVIVATIAFGMGIDKSNVRYVIHRDMPKTIENYYQEIGRAGRDGLDSDCVLFYSWADVIGHERFLERLGDPVVQAETQKKTVEMFRLADRRACRHRQLAAYLDEEIDDCGEACDVCQEKTLDDLMTNAVLEKRPAAASSRRSPQAQGAGRNDPLFQELKALRKTLADRQGVPAYIVFSDAVLARMAAEKPQSPEALLGISGVGQVKLERYGEAFLQVLREGA